MAVTALIARADLNARFGAATVTRFADDIGDDSASDDNLDVVLEEATSIALGYLRRAWTTDQVSLLVTNDPAVKGALCDIAMGVLSRRRPEFIGPDGKSLYAAVQKAGEDRLDKMAKAELRPAGETTAGANPIVRTTTNRDTTIFTFQGTKANPKAPGGF